MKIKISSKYEPSNTYKYICLAVELNCRIALGFNQYISTMFLENLNLPSKSFPIITDEKKNNNNNYKTTTTTNNFISAIEIVTIFSFSAFCLNQCEIFFNRIFIILSLLRACVCDKNS